MNLENICGRLEQINGLIPTTNEAARYALGELIAELKDEIFTKTAKKSGRAEVVAGLKKILKRGAKSGRAVLGNAGRLSDGRTAVCDGYCFAVVNGENALPEECYSKQTDLNGIYKTVVEPLAFKGEAISIDTAKLFTDIKAERARIKAEKSGKPLDLKIGEAYYSAEYVMDTLQAVNGDTVRLPQENMQNLYLFSEIGEGIVCPVYFNYDQGKKGEEIAFVLYIENYVKKGE